MARGIGNINDIINHPNFAQAMGFGRKATPGTAMFRGMVEDYLKSGKNTSHISIEFKDGKPVFVVPKGYGKLHFTSLEEAVDASKGPLTSIRRYTGKQSRQIALQPHSGNQFNTVLETLSEKLGVDIEIRSYHPGELPGQAASYIMDQIKDDTGGLRGIAVPDSDIVHTIQMFRRNNKGVVSSMSLTHDEIVEEFKKAGISFDPNGPLFKRMKALLNERSLQMAQTDTRFSVGLFDPQKLFATTAQHGEAAKLYTQRVSKMMSSLPGLTKEEGMLRMFEGGLFGSRSFAEQFIQNAEKRAKVLESFAKDKELLGDLESARAARAQARSLAQEATSIRQKLLKGASFNFRSAGGIGISGKSDVDDIGMFKGDITILEDEEYKRLARQVGWDGKGRMPHILAAAAEEKRQMTIRTGMFGFQSLEYHPAAGSVLTHSLEIATFPEHFTTDFLESSLTKELEGIRASLKTGKLPRDMAKQLREVLDFDLSLIVDPQEASQIANLQHYARNLMSVVENGVPITGYEKTALAFYQGYKKKFEKFRKGHFREYLPSGEPDRAYRTTLPHSASAHASTMEPLRSATKYNSPMDLMLDTIRYDKESGRFLVPGPTIQRIFKATGGMDLDDRLKAGLFYDPRAKRMSSLILRDPNERKEFSILTADITSMFESFAPGERNLPIHIKAALTNKRKLTEDLYNSLNKKVGRFNFADNSVQTKLKQLQAINQTLDHYFSTSDLRQRDIYDEITSGALSAPKSHTVNTRYLESDVMMGFHGEGMTTQQFGETLARNFNRNIAGSITPFEYVNDFFNQFDQNRHIMLVGGDDAAKRVALFERYGKVRRGSVMTMEDYLTGKIGAAEVAKLKAGSKATTLAEFQEAKLALGDETSGLLGRYVNTKTLADQLSAAIANPDVAQEIHSQGALMRTIAGFKSAILEREDVIDASTKELLAINTKAAEYSMEDMITSTTRTIMALREAGVTDAGFDPLLFATRAKGTRGQFLSAARAHATATGNAMWEGLDDDALLESLIAPEDGRFSLHTQAQRMYERVSREQLLAAEQELREGAQRFGDDMYGHMAFSNAETQFARDFVGEYRSALEDARSLGSPLDRMSQILEGGLYDDPDFQRMFYGQEEVNRRLIDFLEKRGLIREGEIIIDDQMRRGMAAIGSFLHQNRAALESEFGDAFNPIFVHSSTEGAGIADIFHRSTSLSIDRNRRLLDNYYSAVNSARQLQIEANSVGGVGNLAADQRRAYERLMGYTTRDGDLRIGRMERLGRKVEELFAGGVEETRRAAEFVVNGNEAEEIGERLHNLFPRVALPAGYKTAVTKQHAAQESINVVDSTVKLLTKERWNEILNIKGVRGGLFTAGIFAAGGLLYGATHHDRSSEQMQGPPLLPGGSSYEDYSDMDSVSSIYPSTSRGQFAPGVLYQVNASGSYNPNQLAAQIQSITGGSLNSTIYRSRAVLNRPISSSDRLRDHMSGA